MYSLGRDFNEGKDANGHDIYQGIITGSRGNRYVHKCKSYAITTHISSGFT